MEVEDRFIPFNVLISEWLPHPKHPSMASFYSEVQNTPKSEWHDCIKELDEFISNDEILTFLLKDACEKNEEIYNSQLNEAAAAQVTFPRISNKEQLLDYFNTILTMPPKFYDDALVGLPFSSIIVGIDPTLSGNSLLRLPMFNERMKKILDVYNEFLGTSESNTVFSKEGEQWLSDAAKKSYNFDVWKKDNENLPYWNSWNSFFTRQFKDPIHARPITAPESNAIVNCANDGSLLRWEEEVSVSDAFWFKDMPYSLTDIFSSPHDKTNKLNSILNEHPLIDMFTYGYIFQTYLNPYNYHRWWIPVNGEVLFDPITIPGSYFEKLVIPDYGGATTASLPYLVQRNARGLLVIKTEDYGNVCCIPLGMSETSSCVFDPAMKAGAKVNKGQEMGKFEYGGSSYVLIFQKLPGKSLVFENSEGIPYERRPVLPKGSYDNGGSVTLIGSQIGRWQSTHFHIKATTSGSLVNWQSAGYINGKNEHYEIRYIGYYPKPPLLGRIGTNGDIFEVNNLEITTGGPGHLYLRVNDKSIEALEGDIEVVITAVTVLNGA